MTRDEKAIRAAGYMRDKRVIKANLELASQQSSLSEAQPYLNAASQRLQQLADKMAASGHVNYTRTLESLEAQIDNVRTRVSMKFRGLLL